MAMLARRGAVSTTSAGCNRTVVRAAVARPSAPVRRSLAPVAAVKMPDGVPTPRRVPTTPEARFGFVAWAEKINGRAAMLGFFGILLVEAIAGKGVFEMAGFTVGQGLGFEF